MLFQIIFTSFPIKIHVNNLCTSSYNEFRIQVTVCVHPVMSSEDKLLFDKVISWFSIGMVFVLLIEYIK